MNNTSIQTKIRNTIESNYLCNKVSDSLLIGVSGGIDSMVLLHILHSLEYKIAIAHCNFNLRGSESDLDQNLVELFAKQNNIPIHIQSFNTNLIAEETNSSIEMVARELRYNWFQELCNSNNYTKIVIAHNENDTIETFFINLLRGSGIKGLLGIPMINGIIIRPMLSIQRTDIEEYATKNTIPFRTDSSNLENKYIRNKIRNIIIPELEKISTNSQNSITTTISHLSDVYKIYTSVIKQQIPTVCKKTAQGISIDEKKLCEFEYGQTLLFEILNPLGFNSDTISQVYISFNTQSGKQFESPSHIAIHDRNTLYIESRISNTKAFQISIKDTFPQTISTPIGNIKITSQDFKPFEINKNKNFALVDYDQLIFPLTIRTWKPGDIFKPFGMKGNKKVSDFLIDEKVPIHKKEDVLVIESGDSIVWLVNYRISQDFCIREKTKSAVTFEFQ